MMVIAVGFEPTPPERLEPQSIHAIRPRRAVINQIISQPSFFKYYGKDYG